MAQPPANHGEQAVEVAALLSPRLRELGERVAGESARFGNNPSGLRRGAAAARLAGPSAACRIAGLLSSAAELVRQRPTITEGRLHDGPGGGTEGVTPYCPRIRLSADQAASPLPGLEQHKTVTWRVNGRTTEHLMLCLAVRLRDRPWRWCDAMTCLSLLFLPSASRVALPASVPQAPSSHVLAEGRISAARAARRPGVSAACCRGCTPRLPPAPAHLSSDG